MDYDDWKLETPEEEDYRIGSLGRTRRNRAMWEEENADYLLEQERDDRMRQMECDDDAEATK